MKITQSDISINDFQRAFIDVGRAYQFSNEGLDGLYEYLTEFENDIVEEYELDVIALCVEYSEYNSKEEYYAQYSHSDIVDCDENIIAELYSGGVIVREW
jgi:hypothetical protein